MAQNSKQVTLARSAVDRRCHVCAFFHSREDEYKVMLPFLKEGLEAGEKVFQIMDQRQRDERSQRLTDAGVDAAAAEQNGLLEVRPWENAHLSDGRFDQHAMIALVEGIAKDGEKRSGVTRLWANMEWALEDFPASTTSSSTSRASTTCCRNTTWPLCALTTWRSSAPPSSWTCCARIRR